MLLTIARRTASALLFTAYALTLGLPATILVIAAILARHMSDWVDAATEWVIDTFPLYVSWCNWVADAIITLDPEGPWGGSSED